MRTGTCGQQRCSHSNGSQDKGILGHFLLDRNLLTYYLRVTFYFLYVIFGNACDKFRPMRTRIKWNALSELDLGGISIKRLANCRISRNLMSCGMKPRIVALLQCHVSLRATLTPSSSLCVIGMAHSLAIFARARARVRSLLLSFHHFCISTQTVTNARLARPSSDRQFEISA